MVDPLLSNGELEKKCSEEERESVFDLSIGKTSHDNSKRVAKEHSQGVTEGLHVEANGFGEALNLRGYEARYYKE